MTVPILQDQLRKFRAGSWGDVCNQQGVFDKVVPLLREVMSGENADNSSAGLQPNGTYFGHVTRSVSEARIGKRSISLPR